MVSEYHVFIIRVASHITAEKNYNIIIYCGEVLD